MRDWNPHFHPFLGDLSSHCESYHLSLSIFGEKYPLIEGTSAQQCTADLSGHPGGIAATKLRELPFAFVPFVLAGPQWCGQHKNIEVGKKYNDDYVYFYFKKLRKHT
jgi:hypothetical protein